MPNERTIAIGDIHGWAAALSTLVEAIDPQPWDTLVALGDYIDRGPDSRSVIDLLMAVQDQCHLVTLLGNHDQLMLWVCDGRHELLSDWRLAGGDSTIASYGGSISPQHLDFVRRCPLLFETEHHFFVHSSYEPDKPLAQQDPFVLLWDSLKHHVPGPHMSGKTAIVGHSKQRSGNILDLGYLKCIDTFCSGTGWLTALNVDSGQVWQADKSGRIR